MYRSGLGIIRCRDHEVLIVVARGGSIRSSRIHKPRKAVRDLQIRISESQEVSLYSGRKLYVKAVKTIPGFNSC